MEDFLMDSDAGPLTCPCCCRTLSFTNQCYSDQLDFDGCHYSTTSRLVCPTCGEAVDADLDY